MAAIRARRVTLGLLGASAGALVRPRRAATESWPDRPLRFVVPVAPGGPADQQARLVGQRLAERLGHPVVVENRPGANGIIAADQLARAAPDGNTIMIVPAGTYVINQSLYRSIPYDAFRDFAPVGLLTRVPLMLVAHPSVPAGTPAGLLAHARSRPQGLAYASSGSGTPSHLAMEMLRGAAGGVPLTHVPFNGSGPALTSVVSGQTEIAIAEAFAASPLVRGGQLKPIAAATLQRLPTFPDLPTIAESVVAGFDAATWLGIVAPARTPPDRVRRLSAEFAAIMALPDVNARIVELGAIPVGGTPAELEAFARAEAEKWGRVVRETGTTAG